MSNFPIVYKTCLCLIPLCVNVVTGDINVMDEYQKLLVTYLLLLH